MISILLPTYNASVTIEQSIRCMLQQTYSDFECLVLDDGSTDDTKEKVLRFSDTRIVYHRLPHQGLAKTLNQGLALAKYDIVARMDADDLCVPWRLEKQLRVLQHMPGNTILSSWYAVFDERGIKHCVKTPTASDEIKKGLLLHSNITHSGLMCYTHVLKENGGYISEGEVDAYEDYQTWLKIKQNVEFAVVPEVLLFIRFRKESLSNNILYKQRVMYAVQQKYYDDLSAHFGITNHSEESVYRGWREYFYGNKRTARTYWKAVGVAALHHPRVLLAWCITFLPEQYFVTFKEARVKFLLQYIVGYYSQRSRKLRRTFRTLVTTTG